MRVKRSYREVHSVIPVREGKKARFAAVKRELATPDYVGAPADLDVCTAARTGTGLSQVRIPYRDLSTALKRLGGQANLEDLAAFFRQEKASLFPQNLEVRLTGDDFGPPIASATFSHIGSLQRGISVEIEYTEPDSTSFRLQRVLAAGFSETPAEMALPHWPAERNLPRYNELTGLKIEKEVEPNGPWVDLGCAKAVALHEVAKDRRIEVAGVNLHKYHKRPAGSFFPVGPFPRIWLFYAKIPENPLVHALYGGRAKLGTDVYNSLSFYRNPLHCFIYLASLLKFGGIGVAVTEPERFGAPANSGNPTWKKMKRFFHTYSGQRVEFEVFKTRGDASGKWEQALRIIIEGKGRCEPFLGTGFGPFSLAYKLAREIVGRPVRKDEILWQADQDGPKIRKVEYSRT